MRTSGEDDWRESSRGRASSGMTHRSNATPRAERLRHRDVHRLDALPWAVHDALDQAQRRNTGPVDGVALLTERLLDGIAPR